jgi:hypothetical protein
MANLASAQAKWERKTSQAASHWEAATKAATGEYCKAMSEFLGVNAGRLCQNYNAGIAATTAASYSQGVAGKGSKWAEGLRRAALG